MKDHTHLFFSISAYGINELIKANILKPINWKRSPLNFDKLSAEYCPKSRAVRIVGTAETLYVYVDKTDEFIRVVRASETTTKPKEPKSVAPIVAYGYEVACLFQSASAAMTPEDYVKIMAILSPVLNQKVVFSVNEEDVSVEVAGMVIKIDVSQRLRNALADDVSRQKEKQAEMEALLQKQDGLFLKSSPISPDALRKMLEESRDVALSLHRGASPQPQEDRQETEEKLRSLSVGAIVHSAERWLEKSKLAGYYVMKETYENVVSYVLFARFEYGASAPIVSSTDRKFVTEVRDALEEKLFA